MGWQPQQGNLSQLGASTCQCPSREWRAVAAQQVARAKTSAMAIRTRTTLSAAVARASRHLERDELERLLPWPPHCMGPSCIELQFVQSLVCATIEVGVYVPSSVVQSSRCIAFCL